MENVNCDLCGSNETNLQYSKPDDWLKNYETEYSVVKCKNCGLVYVNPRPTFEGMRDFYPDGYHSNRDDQIHNDRYIKQFDYVNETGIRNVLDIGCAQGDWLNFLENRISNVKLFGIDAFSKGVKNQKINFQNCNISQAALEPNTFDLVTAWAVLEHVHNPMQYFVKVSNVLVPGGKFIFLVTNSQSIYGKYAYKEDIPRHTYHFDKNTLSNYANKSGLILQNIRHDPRFWDGSGKGLFFHLMRKILRISWSQIGTRNINIYQN